MKQRLPFGYTGGQGAYDELLDSSGGLRAHWQPLIDSIQTVDVDELNRRMENTRRLVWESGVTYNIYGDLPGQDRSWELDIIPLVIPADEWSRIERGLVQRARLLNLILADLYGSQRLLIEGLLPPGLVLANPAFLRACHGFRPVGNIHLHLYAVDLVRSSDGQWWVAGDRTQTAAGAGYALENRIVMSRALPDALRNCQVRRLSGFFRGIREMLRQLAPRGRDDPRVVLLTAGPGSKTYFEHVYLAQYLGYTLVEGGDLTVRDSRVFLKTLEGLQLVDVIWRRLADDLCDPLELRGDSFWGVAGLLEAARTGNVAVVNSLGSGLVETPAIMPFLPGLCRHLLGEDLRLPSVATWWCGQPGPLATALENLDGLIIKPAFRTGGGEFLFGDKLDAEGKRQLQDRMRAAPQEFVGQQRAEFSTAPSWNNSRLEPRSIMLRTQLVAAGDSYLVMPGGMTRVSAAPDALARSIQGGTCSKDTWVLADSSATAPSPAVSSVQRLEIRRSGNDLPSRAADNLFWLGRYAERTENIARLLRSVLVRLTGEAGTAWVSELPPLVHALAYLGQIRAGLPEAETHAPMPGLEQELISLIYDEKRVGNLRETLSHLHRGAWAVRERLSTDTWRILSPLNQEFVHGNPRGAVRLGDSLALLNRLIIAMATFSGMEMENMTRGVGWRFLEMGRRLERSMHLVSLIRSILVEAKPDATPVLETLLEVADSAMTYRSRYFTSVQVAPVLDLLMTDESNPRSLAFQLVVLDEHVEHIPRDSSKPFASREKRVAMVALAALRLADIEVLSQPEEDGVRHQLDTLLSRMEEDLPAFSDAITRGYFAHSMTPRQLVDLRTENV